MDNERYLWLMTRRLTGEITGKEEEELDALAKESAYAEEKHKLFEKIWDQEVFNNPSAETSKAFKKVLEKINDQDGEQEGERREAISFFNFRNFAVAASILFAIAIGVFAVSGLKKSKPEVALTEKANGSGTKSMVKLSDGTTVWVNSQSTIKYPEKFSEEVREVYLTGEAFFKVAHNPEKPFLINLNGARIKVLGTSFNVKAYPDEEEIQTSVLTGKVAFITRASVNPDTVFLTRNKKAVFSTNTGEIVTRTVNTSDDKEWINGKLIFKSQNLEYICKQLERSFGKKIIFQNKKLSQQKYTGTFDDSSLEEILYLLSLSKTFNYTSTDSVFTIY